MRGRFVPSRPEHYQVTRSNPTRSPDHYAGSVSGGAGVGAGAAAIAECGGVREIMLSVVIGAITGLVSEIVLDWYRERKEERKALRMKEQAA